MTVHDALLAKLLAGGSGGSGGASQLPEVDSGDNGKILSVVEGAWGKAEMPEPQGPKVVIINAAWDSTASAFKLDGSTFSDISQAVQNGDVPVLRLERTGVSPYVVFASLTNCFTSEADFVYTTYGAYDPAPTIVGYNVDSSNNLTKKEYNRLS